MTNVNKKLIPVSVIIPMKNSETTILLTLKSLQRQKYSIREIIIIDNVSSDKSVEIVENYAKKSKIKLSLIKRKKNKGVGESYNEGTKKAKSKLVVFMHSDSTLDSSEELTKLIEPLLLDTSVVATYSTTINPDSVWETYNFWQKCLLARATDRENPGMNGKFDCLRRDIFLEIGGFNSKYFSDTIGTGGEDGDLHIRLEQEGKIVLSSARVIHLHYLGKNYKFSDWIKNRKLLARTYGSIIRIEGFRLPIGALAFGIKPALAIIPLIPGFFGIGVFLFFLYTFWYTKKMFLSKSTRTDPRIILLPLMNIFLVYYETFWMVETFLSIKRK